MVYKSSIVKSHSFSDWVKRACLDIKHQTRIDKVLYYYNAEYTTISETTELSDETI